MPEGAPQGAIAVALAQALGRPVVVSGLRPVVGGCISVSAVVETDLGSFFAKWNAEAPADLFLREADGLRALAAAGGHVAIPAVHCARAPQDDAPGFIVMEYLAPAPAGSIAEEALGRGLAEIHRATAVTFGFAGDTYCGATRQPNEACASWTEFYALRRLQPLLTAIEAQRGLGSAERKLYERVIGRLPELLGSDSTPALIHGDLWSGNVLFTERGPALVDPACAFAEREMEFGITTLFGGMTPRAWAAYEETFPLAPGWRERNPLYQLYHLLNHQLLFGGGYGAQALTVARRFA